MNTQHIHVERHPEPHIYRHQTPSHDACRRELETVGKLPECRVGRPSECMALLLAESGWNQ